MNTEKYFLIHFVISLVMNVDIRKNQRLSATIVRLQQVVLGVIQPFA
jgi:hypothetical protein